MTGELYDTQGAIRNPLENVNAVHRQIGMVLSSTGSLQQPLLVRKIRDYLCKRGTYRWARVSRSPREAGHSRVSLQKEKRDFMHYSCA